MLPVSSSDIIEFRPAQERITAAKEAVEAARTQVERSIPAASGTAKKTAQKSDAQAAAEMGLAAATDVLTEAEEAAALKGGDPIFRLRVPTERSKAAVNRDISGEAIVLRTNIDVLDAALASPDEISPDDAEFLKSVRERSGKTGVISDVEWPHVFTIARSVRGSAGIIADWLYHASVRRIHYLRHHLIIEGERSPLPERVVDGWINENRSFVAVVGDKIDALLVIKETPAKN